MSLFSYSRISSSSSKTASLMLLLVIGGSEEFSGLWEIPPSSMFSGGILGFYRRSAAAVSKSLLSPLGIKPVWSFLFFFIFLICWFYTVPKVAFFFNSLLLLRRVDGAGAFPFTNSFSGSLSYPYGSSSESLVSDITFYCNAELAKSPLRSVVPWPWSPAPSPSM